MKYISTRGRSPAAGFEDVLLTGLASDGGLFVPETLPEFDTATLEQWRRLPYNELAFQVMHPFVGDSIADDDFREIIDDTYRDFGHRAIAPLVQLGHNDWLLELFHGPTLAFKDYALQLLGRLFDYVLTRRDQRVVVLGATSGDTGSAAIEGCSHSDHLDVFILHPYQRVSEVQRRQMTTVLADNVHNIAVEGNFDDCQAMVKASFSDQSFLPAGRQLVAVNSINWARIMAQIVYYFYAGIALGAPHRKLAFSVPTGNFGDIFAGYLAKRMGLPIDQLVIATNRNDILHRFMCDNRYERGELVHTLSPSMDIMISSNFERMLFELYGRDGAALATLMKDFDSGPVSVPDEVFVKARALFDSYTIDDEMTVRTIADEYERTGYLLDPHSAIGVHSGRACRKRTDIPLITLATAHPAKFPDAVQKAGNTPAPGLPHHLADLFEREERYDVLPKDLGEIQRFIAGHVHA